jgi:hypothetical protein
MHSSVGCLVPDRSAASPAPGAPVLNVVGVTYLHFDVGDEMRLSHALQVANDALREIGREDLRAELREL